MNEQKNYYQLYKIIAIASAVILVIAAILLFFFTRDSLELSVKDGDTLILEYGIDKIPPVTAMYWSSAFDKEGTTIPVDVRGTVDETTLGTYTITYTASHNDKTVIATQTIIIQDTTAPVITLNGGETGYYSPGYTYTEQGFTATDNYDGDLTAQVVCAQNTDSITYSISDRFGNTTSVTRTLECKDVVAPIITLNGSDHIEISQNAPFTDDGATAADDVDGDLTAALTVAGTIDTSVLGEQTLTYQVTDSSGNLCEVQRIVNVIKVVPNGKVIYLSFDDGPGPYTQQLLDILDKYNVKVTFFVTNQFSDYQNMIGEAHRRGHTIALHTYSHRVEQVYKSESAYYDDLNKIKAICEAQTGVSPTIVRFPGGTSNTTSKKYCRGIMTALTQSLPANGYQYCDWNVDSMDAGGAKTASQVARNVISAVPNFKHSFVLQHDTKLYSVEAVEEIINWGLANGYTFLPMEADSPMYHHPPLN